jgi:hypothetical protein
MMTSAHSNTDHPKTADANLIHFSFQNVLVLQIKKPRSVGALLKAPTAFVALGISAAVLSSTTYLQIGFPVTARINSECFCLQK